MVLFASDYDKSKYLRAEDLKQETKFRIKAVTEEVFEKDGKAEKKLVVWFTNDERGLVLNKTNNRTIRGAFGDDTCQLDRQDHRCVSDDDRRPRQDDPRPAGAHSAAEAGPAPAPAAPQQPVTSGNGAAAAPAAVASPLAAAPVAAAAPLAAAATGAAVDPELEPDPVKPIREELDDEIPW